jgi:hypothetical protein
MLIAALALCRVRMSDRTVDGLDSDILALNPISWDHECARLVGRAWVEQIHFLWARF